MYESRRVAYEELNFSRVELAYPQDFSRTRAHLIAWRGFAAMQLVPDHQTFSLSLLCLLVVMASLSKVFHLTLLVQI